MRPDKYDEESYNTYAQITERLVPYVKQMGFYPRGIDARNGTSI
jgi:hypothetical protein